MEWSGDGARTWQPFATGRSIGNKRIELAGRLSVYLASFETTNLNGLLSVILCVCVCVCVCVTLTLTLTLISPPLSLSRARSISLSRSCRRQPHSNPCTAQRHGQHWCGERDAECVCSVPEQLNDQTIDP